MRIYIYRIIISFNFAGQLHLRYIEVTDSSNYYFFIVVLYRQFKVCFQNVKWIDVKIT